MDAHKAIVFDLLTALLDSWTVWDTSIEPVEKHIASGTTWRKRYLELTYGCGEYVDYETLVHRAAHDVGLSDATANNLSLNWDQIQPWPEVPAVLAQLKSQGFRLGVVTNCSTELGRRAVRNCEVTVKNATGVDVTFDEVITAEESGFYKPNPKPYRDLLQKLGVNAEEALFVAGSSGDIPGASGVGMKVVWNNHVGLERKTDLSPWRQGKRLDEALGDVLKDSSA
jgi:2-haloacid dehalogenase